jgi:peptidyl-prolyl cis-trans isomerase C
VKSFLTILACAALLGAQPPAAPAPPAAVPGANLDPGTVVLTVGDRKITAAQFEQIVRAIFPAPMQPFALGPGKRAAAQKIVEMVVLSAEADKQKLGEQPSAKDQIELQRRTTLSVHEFQKIVADIPVTDAQIQSFYDANQALYATIHVRHILVRVRGSQTPARPGKPELSDSEALEKAKSIRQRIVAGADFAEVARDESDDSSAKDNGDIGMITRGKTPPQFEAAAFELKPGDVSDPVRTQFGYHIIQVMSRSVRPLADVKDEIPARLRQAAAPAVVRDMVTKTSSHLDEKFFGPDPPAAPPAATPPAKAPAAPK